MQASRGKQECVYKVVLIGDPATGKTSLMRRYVGRDFASFIHGTVSSSNIIITIVHNNIQSWLEVEIARHIDTCMNKSKSEEMGVSNVLYCMLYKLVGCFVVSNVTSYLVHVTSPRG